MTSHTDTVDIDHDESLIEAAPAGLFTRFAAEFIGTFLLVFIGFGVALYTGVTVNPDESLRLLSWGVGLLVAVALFGHVSGGHFNPAVSLASAITGRTAWADMFVYWVAQVAGGVAAAGLLFLTIPSALPVASGAATRHALFASNASGYGEHSLVGRVSSGTVATDLIPVLLIETIATALFVGVALMARRWTDGKRLSAAVVTGLAYGALSVTAYSLTGGALNPARATAGALFAEGWAVGQLWLFWLAPLVGAAIAGLLVTIFAPDPLPVYDEDVDYDEEVDADYADSDDPDHHVRFEDDEDETAADSTEEQTAEDPSSIPGDSPVRDDAFTEDYDVTADDDDEATDAVAEAEHGDEPEATPR